MKLVKLKYLCSSFSTPIMQLELSQEGQYRVYGAGGLAGYKSDYCCDKPYLGIVKDGAGVGRINQYEPYTSLLGTLSYVIPNKDVDIGWLKYSIMSLDLGNDVGKTTIPHIYFSEYGNRHIYYVPLSEQEAIADFLDKQCAEIDSVIEQTKATIEEYKKLKQSVITEAVTKGIRGDRPMKDSGIEWIGEIPSEWEIRKLFRAIDNIGDIDHYMPASVDNGIPYLMTGDLAYISNYENSREKIKKFKREEILLAFINYHEGK